ncbi:MAG TPA: hypothetical protein VM347_10330 [Nonomuraea sp.]|nr:hypothetical protein [Nonomuraea sp.]
MSRALIAAAAAGAAVMAPGLAGTSEAAAAADPALTRPGGT